jgi:2-amino-4-hydroxy-6-hydroxymethyldihydropteridine diphosphokinase
MHDVIAAAARGDLPEWSKVSRRRRGHIERVAALLGDWASVLALPDTDCIRWRAAGFLHDALREVPPEDLRDVVPPSLRTLSGKLLHGPAAAERLRRDGVDDESLLRAVAYHTIGHPELDQLGRALFIADYIEPGRRYAPDRLAVLRARMPAAFNEVLEDVLRERIARQLGEGRSIRSETIAFWNAVTNHDHGAA